VGVFGGVPYDFFDVGGYAPGATLGGSTGLFFASGFAQFGGNTYNLGLTNTGSVFLSPFTLRPMAKTLRSERSSALRRPLCSLMKITLPLMWRWG